MCDIIYGQICFPWAVWAGCSGYQPLHTHQGDGYTMRWLNKFGPHASKNIRTPNLYGKATESYIITFNLFYRKRCSLTVPQQLYIYIARSNKHWLIVYSANKLHSRLICSSHLYVPAYIIACLPCMVLHRKLKDSDTTRSPYSCLFCLCICTVCMEFNSGGGSAI